MLKIRLVREGRHKLPFYRVVAIKSEAKRNGRAIAFLGTYNPISKDIHLEEDRTSKFLEHGAQPTKTAAYLLRKKGLLTEKNKIKN